MTTPAALPLQYETPPSIAAPAAGGRVLWLDLFRGFTMVCLVAEGFGLLRFKDSRWVGPLARQFDHTDWQGMRAWDLVQPFFMFIVGAAMPFAFAKRWAAGESWMRSLLRVLRRCALLVGWGLVARSLGHKEPTLDLINVLAQIAFTYLVAFLVLRKPIRVQALVAAGLLLAHWALYQFWRPPGVAGPWVKGSNPGVYLDRLVLHKYWWGGYATINCVSSAANTLAGVMAGKSLAANGGSTTGRRVAVLAVCGLLALCAGLALSPWVPIVKKIWTPSFALVSIGCTLWALVAFYGLFQLRPGSRLWGLFLAAGANSIFLYLVGEIFGPFLRRSAAVFTGWASRRSPAWGGFLNDWIVLAIELGVVVWLYRRKIFFRL